MWTVLFYSLAECGGESLVTDDGGSGRAAGTRFTFLSLLFRFLKYYLWASACKRVWGVGFKPASLLATFGGLMEKEDVVEICCEMIWPAV